MMVILQNLHLQKFVLSEFTAMISIHKSTQVDAPICRVSHFNAITQLHEWTRPFMYRRLRVDWKELYL